MNRFPRFTTATETPVTAWGRIVELRDITGRILASTPMCDHDLRGNDRGTVTASVIDGLRRTASLGAF